MGVTTPAPAPSGTFIQARVSERFELLDQTQVVTQPFTQDLVSYATPRPGVGGTLGAAFPITPSRNFTIQELMLGVVRLDVTPFIDGDTASVLGPGGGTVTNAEGDTLQVPAGALPDDVSITLRRVTAADAGVTVPAGFDLIAALQVDMVGVNLTAPAQLSIAAAAGLTTQDQILVARAFNDPFGQRRLKLVAIGELSGGRLVTRTTFGALSLAGVRNGGEFVYLRAQQPIGFVVGTVTRSSGTALSGVLVTSDTVSIADVTGADGRYVVAGRTGIDTTLRALDLTSRDGVSAVLRLDTAGQVLTANLTLSVVGPTVVAVNPAAGATGVRARHVGHHRLLRSARSDQRDLGQRCAAACRFRDRRESQRVGRCAPRGPTTVVAPHGSLDIHAAAHGGPARRVGKSADGLHARFVHDARSLAAGGPGARAHRRRTARRRRVRAHHGRQWRRGRRCGGHRHQRPHSGDAPLSSHSPMAPSGCGSRPSSATS